MGNVIDKTKTPRYVKFSRTQNTVRNVVAGFVNKIVTLLLPFILRTVLIKKIGIEYAGLNGLFSSILQVLNLSELGFGQAVVYSMYKPIAENDGETICALLAFYRRAYLVVGCAILVVGAFLMPFLPKLIRGEIPSDVNLYSLYAIFLLDAAISYLMFGYRRSLLEAHQRQDVLSNILTLTTGAMNICQIIILCAARNYYFYILLMPIFTVANNILVAISTTKMFREFTVRGKISGEKRKEIKKNVAGLAIGKICGVSRNSLDSIFISAFLGLQLTAIYSNYFLVMSAVIGVLSIFTSSIVAGVGNSIQIETQEKNYVDMRKINFLYMWISTWCASCLLCLYQPFMRLWIGKDALLDFSSVCLLTLYFFVLKMGDIRSVYAEASGIWWEQRWRAVIEAAANLVLNFVLVQILGINGIIIATLVSLFTVNFLGGTQIVFKCYFKNGKTVEYILIQMKNLLVAVVTSGVAFFFCRILSRTFAMNSLMELCANFAVCLIIANAFFMVANCRSVDFLQAAALSKSVAGRRR